MKTRITSMLALVLLVAGLLGGAVLAQETPSLSYSADLDSLNDSGATGTVTLSLDGTTLTVGIEATGLSPDLPHAQHIHGALDGSAPSCPTPEADTDDDGFITVAEGAPFYGGILVSLTTEGDTSPDSALAVDRMPVADDTGAISYTRDIEVSQEIADAISSLHVVQHGIDLDDSGAYDGDRPSSINPDLPLEATIPADCGGIELSSVGAQDVNRLAGTTRIGTAVEISQQAFPDGAAQVYLARSDVLADAVAGGVLTDGPILLVPSCGDLPGLVAEEIGRLAPDGITALGGDAAICDDIVIQAALANS